jgi:hypothetical protein
VGGKSTAPTAESAGIRLLRSLGGAAARSQKQAQVNTTRLDTAPWNGTRATHGAASPGSRATALGPTNRMITQTTQPWSFKQHGQQTKCCDKVDTHDTLNKPATICKCCKFTGGLPVECPQQVHPAGHTVPRTVFPVRRAPSGGEP